jgi:hypothetical protein
MTSVMPGTGVPVPAPAETQLDAVGRAVAPKATTGQELSTLKSDGTRDTERDYAVGYCKPPRHSRFKEGQSGNPRGRPAGSKSLKTLVTQELNEDTVITEDGRPRKITKREAVAIGLVNRSATGDFRAVKILLDIEGQAEPLSRETAAYSEADEKIFERLRKRFTKKQTP